MKSCPFVFSQACSLSVNTLTLHKMITSEADGFHSEGVVFLHSPVMGELKNAMQRTRKYIGTHIFTRTHQPHISYRQGSLTTLPELSGVDIFSVLEGSLYHKIMAVESTQQRLSGWIFWRRFESPELYPEQTVDFINH